mmetsp:Transcript_20556/g.31430  ORF Transcript_20556/g.31430 Transcript_20556/m.31430 type:complete len:86 (-) Transcript_20556:235-492(-)
MLSGAHTHHIADTSAETSSAFHHCFWLFFFDKLKFTRVSFTAVLVLLLDDNYCRCVSRRLCSSSKKSNYRNGESSEDLVDNICVY